MAVTKILPLGVTSSWYTDVFAVNAVLLRDDVTSIPDTAQTYNDISDLEISTGDYPSYGISMGLVSRVANTAAGVVEWDTGQPTWTQVGSATFSAPAFRWIVLIKQTGGAILAMHDLGGTKSITTGALVLTVTESTYSPGVYPILRMRRTLT